MACCAAVKRIGIQLRSTFRTLCTATLNMFQYHETTAVYFVCTASQISFFLWTTYILSNETSTATLICETLHSYHHCSFGLGLAVTILGIRTVLVNMHCTKYDAWSTSFYNTVRKEQGNLKCQDLFSSVFFTFSNFHLNIQKSVKSTSI